MKKLLLLAFMAVTGMAMAQTPTVEITVTDITPTTLSASFHMNADCQEYVVCLDNDGAFDMFAQMMGATYEQLVAMWGVTYTTDASYTWDELVPASLQTIYVLARGANNTEILYSLDTITLSQGGSGESIITITVSEITATTARVIATPNDQTSLFKSMLTTEEYYNQIGEEGAIQLLKEDSYTFYETDDWTWPELESGTTYCAIAIGQNTNSDWGRLAKETFTTLGSNGIAHVANSLRVYPNPSTGAITINGINAGNTIAIYSLDGKLEHQATAASNDAQLDLSQLPRGIHMLTVNGDAKVRATRIVLK